MRGIVGRIKIDSDQPGAVVQTLGVTLNHARGQRRCHAIELPRTSGVLEARQRGLRSQIQARNRIAVQQHLVNRVGAQAGGVVGIRITTGDGEDTLREKILKRRIDLARLPSIAQTARHAADQTIAPFGSLQQHRTPIGGALPLVEFQHHGLGENLCKTWLLPDSRAEPSFGQGSSMPWACQDWANTKAAYRFFANRRVDQTAILSGHFKATQSRFDTVRDAGPVLVLHDTTEFSYRREKTASIGLLKTSYLWRDREGRPRNHTLCGLLMHSGLVVTTDGIPLGLAAIKFWTRKKFKGTNALKKKINPTRVPIEQKESLRWIEGLHQATKLLATPEAIVHIGDRESDIYELFVAAQDAGTHFLFRTCVDRLTGNDGYRVSAVMEEVHIKGLHRIEVRDKKGNVSQAVLELRYHRLRIQPPAGKKKRYPELDLTILHAQERGTPLNRDAVDWKLITDLPIASRQ